MELRDALQQIGDIRLQIARTMTFRGYRSVTTAFTAAVAVGAGLSQSLLVNDPINQLSTYLDIWLAAAMVSLIVVAAEMIWRCARSEHTLQRELSLAAAEQFAPSLIGGALLTYVIVRGGGENAWLLPGLWMILFSMGVFASRRLLSRPIALVGAFYLLAGLVVMALPRGQQLMPWVMGGVFAVGQAFSALILYWTLERPITDD